MEESDLDTRFYASAHGLSNIKTENRTGGSWGIEALDRGMFGMSETMRENLCVQPPTPAGISMSQVIAGSARLTVTTDSARV